MHIVSVPEIISPARGLWSSELEQSYRIAVSPLYIPLYCFVLLLQLHTYSENSKIIERVPQKILSSSAVWKKQQFDDNVKRSWYTCIMKEKKKGKNDRQKWARIIFLMAGSWDFRFRSRQTVGLFTRKWWNEMKKRKGTRGGIKRNKKKRVSGRVPAAHLPRIHRATDSRLLLHNDSIPFEYNLKRCDLRVTVPCTGCSTHGMRTSSLLYACMYIHVRVHILSILLPPIHTCWHAEIRGESASTHLCNSRSQFCDYHCRYSSPAHLEYRLSGTMCNLHCPFHLKLARFLLPA